MIQIFRTLLCLYLVLFVFGCSSGKNVSSSQLANEVVLNKGMQITATNKNGTLIIKAGSGFERFYTWEGATRSQILEPRTKRWAGRFGIGFSGAYVWKNHGTITNVNLEETQLHFNNLERAMAFLNHHSRMNGFTVYNDTGVVVTWKKALHPSKTTGNVLIVELVQIYIAGEKPTKLRGSQNDKIQIINKKGSE